MLCAPEPVVPEALAYAAARLTPGGVELIRFPSSSGPHSIRAVPPPPEPATRGRRQRHATRQLAAVRGVGPRRVSSWWRRRRRDPRGLTGVRRGSARPSAPRANQPDRPSLPMTRRQAALATMGLRVCHGRSQPRHALRRCESPLVPLVSGLLTATETDADADKSARGQPRRQLPRRLGTGENQSRTR